MTCTPPYKRGTGCCNCCPPNSCNNLCISYLASQNCFDCAKTNNFVLQNSSGGSCVCDITPGTLTVNPDDQFTEYSSSGGSCVCDITPSTLTATPTGSACFTLTGCNLFQLQSSTGSGCTCNIVKGIFQNGNIFINVCPVHCIEKICISTPCGIEVSRGVMYSVGGQWINISYVGSCDCIIEPLLVNGQTPPVFVSDGGVINITPALEPGCTIYQKQFTCSTNAFFFVKTEEGMKIVPNKSLVIALHKKKIMEKLKSYLEDK
jgi:hypothetical protein